MHEPYSAAISAWLEASAQYGPFHFGDRLAGATTATIVTCSTATGLELVVKIYDREIEYVGSGDVERDAAAMIGAAEVDLAVPRLIAADADGGWLGWPALIMTRLAGGPRAFGGDDPDGWVDGLADALIGIGAAPPPTTSLPTYESWAPSRIDPPTWSQNHTMWSAIATALSESRPASAPRFIHRDFHQLNVLWNDHTVTGTVDWVNGCVGPIESDIASCRVNIALADRRYDGVGLADRFLTRCRDSGLPWHFAWDLDFIAGVSDRPEMFLVGTDLGAEMSVESVQEALEAMAAAALKHL